MSNYSVTATIADGASDSDAVDLHGGLLTWAQIPADFEGGNIVILHSPTKAGTFTPLVDAAGEALSWVAASSTTVKFDDASKVSGLAWIKLRSTDGTDAANQSGAAVIVLGVLPL